MDEFTKKIQRHNRRVRWIREAQIIAPIVILLIITMLQVIGE
jgi:hypothetical protein